MNPLRFVLIGFVGIFLIASSFLFALEKTEHLRSSQKRTNETELNVEIDFVLGKFMLNSGERNQIYSADIDYDPEKFIPEVNYAVEAGTGYLEITGDSDNGDDINLGKDDNRWDVHINPVLPTNLSIEVGLGKGILELGGTNIIGLSLENGLSETELNFSSPVRKSVERISIETGLGRFRAKNLANARFEELSFECGMGSATLDFHGVHGDGLDNCEVTVTVGLGSATLIVPQDIGVRVEAEKSFLSGLSLDSDFRQRDDTYYTSNWNNSKKRMQVQLEVGLGNINVERIE